jgi:hypothetical protein
MMKRLERLKNAGNKYMADIRPDTRIEELLEASFSMWSVSYQRKIGDSSQNVLLHICSDALYIFFVAVFGGKK